MKYIFYALIFIIWFVWVSKMQLKFSPFRVTFQDLSFALAWICLIIAAILFQVSGYSKGETEGYKEAIDDVIKFNNDKQS